MAKGTSFGLLDEQRTQCHFKQKTLGTYGMRLAAMTGPKEADQRLVVRNGSDFAQLGAPVAEHRTGRVRSESLPDKVFQHLERVVQRATGAPLKFRAAVTRRGPPAR
jgi:hypothetical protein